MVSNLGNNIYMITTGGYNSYLIKGEKTALIDTVPREFCAEFLSEIQSVVKNKSIDYIVFNHTEPDRAGCFEAVMEKYPAAEVAATIAGLKNLKRYTERIFSEKTAKNGNVLDLGGVSLKFLIAPFLNWPDTMITICPECGFAFTADLFAATGDYEKKKKKNFAGYIAEAIKKLENEKPQMILPGNGEPVFEEWINDIFIYHKKIAESFLKKKQKICIIYSTVYGAVLDMAKKARKVCESRGVETVMLNAQTAEIKDIENALLDSDAVIVGTDTINRNMPKAMWRLVFCVDAAGMYRKRAMIFGSYGWSGEGTVILSHVLTDLKFSLFEEKPYTVILKPKKEEMKKFEEYTIRFISTLQ